MSTVDGRWRTDATEQAEAAMAARLEGARLELEALRANVKAARHPWAWAIAGMVVCGVVVALVAFLLAPVVGWTAVALAIAALVWAVRRKRAADRVLASARAPMDALILERVLDIQLLGGGRDALAPFVELGAFGRFDDIAGLYHFRHAGRAMLDVHLTREDTTTTTDSQGRTQTETRTVTVFDGLVFALPFPDVPGPERVVLSNTGLPRPRGRFARPARFRKLSVASPRFSRRFKLWADDPVTGHLVADPDRVMRWLLMGDDLRDMLGRKRDPGLLALVTQGRMWVVMEGINGVRIRNFHEGKRLERELAATHRAASIPAAMARHLRL